MRGRLTLQGYSTAARCDRDSARAIFHQVLLFGTQVEISDVCFPTASEEPDLTDRVNQVTGSPSKEPQGNIPHDGSEL